MWPEHNDPWEGTATDLLEAAAFAMLFCAMAAAALVSFNH